MINFTPGPSQLYFTVADHLRRAMRDQVGSISHRSKAFENIFEETVSGLRSLLSIPSDYHIFFTGSANEIWERVVQNLVEKHSFHLVNGAFSKRFFEIAGQYQKQPFKIEAADGHGFDESFVVDPLAEVIAVTQNETSTGVSLPPGFIHSLKSKTKNSLVVVDAVSSLPYAGFDYSKVDSVFFSVQKGFGLPAGLGVWIVNNACIEKAKALQAKGISIGSYHNLPTLLSNGLKNQTPETPNVLGIYLLGKVVGDMLLKGIDRIRKETEYKAAILYQALDQNEYVKAFVHDPAHQSKTVVTVDCGTHLAAVTEALEKTGLSPGEGYGPYKKTQLRFANFPTHSKENFEALVDTLAGLKL